MLSTRALYSLIPVVEILAIFVFSDEAYNAFFFYCTQLCNPATKDLSSGRHYKSKGKKRKYNVPEVFIRRNIAFFNCSVTECLSILMNNRQRPVDNKSIQLKSSQSDLSDRKSSPDGTYTKFRYTDKIGM